MANFKGMVIKKIPDTTQAILDWLDYNPDMKDYDVPLVSDKTADIGRQFGVLQQCVRYHCVLDSRVAFNMGGIARLVPHIKLFYGTKFGGGKDSCEDCPNEVTED